MNFKKTSRLNESENFSNKNKKEFSRKTNLITPGRNSILSYIEKTGYVTEIALSNFINNLNETEVKTSMDWINNNGNFFNLDKQNQHKIISLSDIGKKVLESSSNKYSTNIEIIDEGKMTTVKRKYTNKYPEKKVQLVTPIRNKILGYVAEKEKVTRSEFIEFLKQMNEELERKTTFKWVTRNKHFFKVIEDKETKEKYWTLSAFGKRVLNRTTVNENISSEEVLNEDYSDKLIKITAKKLEIDIFNYDMNQLKIGMEFELLSHGSNAKEVNITDDNPEETLKLVIGNLKLDPLFYTSAKEEDWGSDFFNSQITKEPSIDKYNVKNSETEWDNIPDKDKNKKYGEKQQDGSGPHGAGEGPGKGKKDGSGLKNKSEESDDEEDKEVNNKKEDDKVKDVKKLLDDKQKEKLRELIDSNAKDEDVEKFAQENDIDIDDLKAYIEILKDDEDNKNESTNISIEFKPIVGKVNEKTVLSIQENTFKNFECKESEGIYKIYDSKNNHIASLIKVNEEWQIHSNKSYKEIKEIMFDSDVNEHHNQIGSTVKIKSTNQTGTLQSWSDIENYYEILLNDGSGKIVTVADEDVETIEQVSENVNERNLLDKNIISDIIDLALQYSDDYEIESAKNKKWKKLQDLIDYINNYIQPRNIDSFMKSVKKIADNYDIEIKETKIINEHYLDLGTKVKCPNGKTGTVQSWNDTEDIYTVLTDDGETLEFKDNELNLIESIRDNKIAIKLGEEYQFTRGLGTVMAIYEDSFIVEWENGKRDEFNFKDYDIKEFEISTAQNVPGMGDVDPPNLDKKGSGDKFDGNYTKNNKKIGRFQVKQLDSLDDFINNNLQESSMNDRLAGLKKITKRDKELEDKLGKAFIKKMYKNIKPNVLAKAAKKAKFVLKKDKRNMGDFGHFIEETYSKQAALWGVTDYENHLKDSIEDIKNILDKKENAFTDPNRTMQNLQYYNVNGKIFDICIISLETSGWSIYPGWSDGGVGFVNRYE